LKFNNYLKDLTINSNGDDPVLDESFKSTEYYSAIITIIDDLNRSLSLTNNKNKFKLTFSSKIPSFKNRDETVVIEKWAKSNEKLTSIKKSFLTYIDSLHFK